MPNEKQGVSRRRLFDAVSAAGVALAATAAANAEPAQATAIIDAVRSTLRVMFIAPPLVVIGS